MKKIVYVGVWKCQPKIDPSRQPNFDPLLNLNKEYPSLPKQITS